MSGSVWEQGRISAYASMLVMGALFACAVWKERVWRRCTWKRLAVVLALTAVLLFPSLYWRASAQWVAQVACLAGWVWALTRLATKDQVADWLLVALLVPTIVGLWQSLTQFVPASTVLGLAEQDPARLGVSVIQVGTERFLRAYGSFPHPNIFGGWLVMALLVGWWRSFRSRLWLGTLPLFALVLYLAFSRSAWVALVAGACVLCVCAWRRAGIHYWLRGAVLIGLTFSVAILARPELLFTRIQASTRLETKSINERVASLEQAWGVVRTYPFGTGVGGYRLGLANLCRAEECTVPTEPPHMVPVLLLAELGLVRTVLLLIGAAYALWITRLRWVSGMAAMVPVFVLACFDHHLWSLWAGQTLFALAVAVFWLHQREKTGSLGGC